MAWLDFVLLLVWVLDVVQGASFVGPGGERARWLAGVGFIISFLTFGLFFAFFFTFAFASGFTRLGVSALVSAVTIGDQAGDPTLFLVGAAHGFLFGFAAEAWVFRFVVPIQALAAGEAHVFFSRM